MALRLILSPTALARGSRDGQRQSAVDPAAGVDGLEELIVYPVELARIVREPMQVERGQAWSAVRLVTETEALVNSPPLLSNRP